MSESTHLPGVAVSPGEEELSTGGTPSTQTPWETKVQTSRTTSTPVSAPGDHHPVTDHELRDVVRVTSDNRHWGIKHKSRHYKPENPAGSLGHPSPRQPWMTPDLAAPAHPQTLGLQLEPDQGGVQRETGGHRPGHEPC